MGQYNSATLVVKHTDGRTPGNYIITHLVIVLRKYRKDVTSYSMYGYVLELSWVLQKHTTKRSKLKTRTCLSNTESNKFEILHRSKNLNNRRIKTYPTFLGDENNFMSIIILNEEKFHNIIYSSSKNGYQYHNNKISN